jgi:6-pyruvoyltetrahydropterin/6-carboxytetrahydropterin synthase
MAVNLYQEYRLKFYLNARRYIVINEQKGEIHPHTWEFVLYLKIGRSSFVQFDQLERGISDCLSKMQNTLINETEPFDTIIPTTENMANYYAEEFYHIIYENGGILTRVELSETPTRCYIINMENREEYSDLREAAQEKALSEVIDTVLDEIVK